MLYSYIISKHLTNNRITKLTSDSGEDLSTPAEIADSLNKYFESVFVKDKTVDECLPHITHRTCTSCNDDGDAIFTLETLYKEIDKLKDNKAIGLEKASPIILKRCKDALSRPLIIIFQKSFSEGIAPYQWKLANVTPINKKGSRKLKSNCRPVSLTSIICKIFESILRRVMYGHFKSNILISIEQHGFVSSKACVTNLLEFLDLTTNALQKTEN